MSKYNGYPLHHIAQEYDGQHPVDVRGSWDLIEIHRTQNPDFMGSSLNALEPYGDFCDDWYLVDVNSIHLVPINLPYKGVAPIEMQPSAPQVFPYDVD